MNTPEQIIAASKFADEVFLTRDEICEVLRISKGTLYKLECAHKGPPKVKIGGCTRYPRKFLEEYLHGRLKP